MCLLSIWQKNLDPANSRKLRGSRCAPNGTACRSRLSHLRGLSGSKGATYKLDPTGKGACLPLEPDLSLNHRRRG
jgi:hypothetical protein